MAGSYEHLDDQYLHEGHWNPDAGIHEQDEVKMTVPIETANRVSLGLLTLIILLEGGDSA